MYVDLPALGNPEYTQKFCKDPTCLPDMVKTIFSLFGM
jgi:hypothetical protein